MARSGLWLVQSVAHARLRVSRVLKLKSEETKVRNDVVRLLHAKKARGTGASD